jgi:terminase small subunit / prophage DNA-packing protein
MGKSYGKTMSKATTTQVSEELGLTPQRVGQLVKLGVLIRLGRGEFDREASVKNYLAHLRRENSGKRGGGAAFTSTAADAPNERIRLAAAQADAQELKNKIALGKLIDASAVETEWAAIVIMTRDAILATPARIRAALPHLSAFDIETIDGHLREVLTRLGSDSAP